MQHRALIVVFVQWGFCCCNDPISPQGLLKFHLISPFSSTGVPMCCQEPTAASHTHTQRADWPEDYLLWITLFIACWFSKNCFVIPYEALYHSCIYPLGPAHLCAVLCILVTTRQLKGHVKIYNTGKPIVDMMKCNICHVLSRPPPLMSSYESYHRYQSLS